MAIQSFYVIQHVRTKGYLKSSLSHISATNKVNFSNHSLTVDYTNSRNKWYFTNDTKEFVLTEIYNYLKIFYYDILNDLELEDVEFEIKQITEIRKWE